MKGRCMCGAVTFKAGLKDNTFNACHCDMCRHWTGSALLAVTVGAEDMNLGEDAPIRTIQSSPWAERAWCDKCGTGLYYRVTADGPYKGTYHVALGTFDEPGDLTFSSEIYFDRKPPNYAFAGERKTMTKAEVEAMFGGDGG